MDIKYRLPLAAFLGALATLVISIVLLVWGFLTWGDDLDLYNTPDNAPTRAAAALLFFSPVFFGAVFLGMLLTSHILHSRRWVNKRVVVRLVITFSFIMAIIPVYKDYRQYGIDYALDLFVGTLVFFMVSLSLGAAAWWRVYHKGLKN